MSYVGLQRSGVSSTLGPPNPIENRLAVDDGVPVGHQQVKEPELRGGQLDPLPAPDDLLSLRVESQVAHGDLFQGRRDGRSAGRRSSAEDSVNAGPQKPRA